MKCLVTVCMKWGQSAAFQRARPDQSSPCLAASPFLHLWTNSWTLPIWTSSVTGDFKRQRATFMSPIRNDKQMAHCWSIVPLKLLLLSAHLQLAVMKRKYGPIADSAVLRRLDVNSPTYEWLGQFRTGRYGCWYWQNRIYGATGIGPNCSQRQEEKRRTKSTVNIWGRGLLHLLIRHLHYKIHTTKLWVHSQHASLKELPFWGSIKLPESESEDAVYSTKPLQTGDTHGTIQKPNKHLLEKRFIVRRFIRN